MRAIQKPSQNAKAWERASGLGIRFWVHSQGFKVYGCRGFSGLSSLGSRYEVEVFWYVFKPSTKKFHPAGLEFE